MINALCALTLVLLLGGCSVTAMRYTPRIETVQTLRHGSYHAVRVSPFKPQAPGVNRVTLRGNPMVSPTHTYERYLEEALRQEFEEAGLLNPQSELEISGVLIRNDVSARIGTGTADLQASFIVMRAGLVLYARIKSTHHEWASAYPENIGIPAAVQNYPIAVQKLVKALVDDPDFLMALKK